jgi:pSer/pThr/pTyr-binding forkhead associated (FHA) protein
VIPPPEPASQPFTIVVSEKGGTDRREVFSTSELNVGRVQGNELMLPKGNVSKRHARLLFRDGRFIVTDLNSTNGTYVNRRRIAQATIVREGDRIYIGDFVLRVELTQGDIEVAEESGTGRPSLATSPETASEPPTPLLEPRESLAPATSGRDPSSSSPSLPPGDRRTLHDAVMPEHRGGTTQERELATVAAHHRDAVHALISHCIDKLGEEVFDAEVTDDFREDVRKLLVERASALTEAGELDESTTEEAIVDDAHSELTVG